MSRQRIIVAAAFAIIAALGSSAQAQRQTVPNPDSAEQMRRLGITGWRADPRNAGQIILQPATFTRDIIRVDVPQLVGKPMFSESSTTICRGRVYCHRQAAQPLLNFFAAAEREGLLGKVLTWDGMYNPRKVRGGNLPSNHAYGLAFDINSAWNGMGVVPAAMGAKGSVREIVELAQHHGWSWGGFYQHRPDGMHFELAAR